MTNAKKQPAYLTDPVYKVGYDARLGSISKDESPYDKEDANYKTWLKGWEDGDDYLKDRAG